MFNFLKAAPIVASAGTSLGRTLGKGIVSRVRGMNYADGAAALSPSKGASAVGPVPACEPLTILITGFGTGSSGRSSSDGPETRDLAEMVPKVEADYGGETQLFGHDQVNAAVDAANKYGKTCPGGEVNVVGHSWGADSAVEVVEKLDDETKASCLVQIDSAWALGDSKKPKTVDKSVNIFSSSNKGMNSEHNVEGAQNIGIPDTSHTEIDSLQQTQDYVVEALNNGCTVPSAVSPAKSWWQRFFGS